MVVVYQICFEKINIKLIYYSVTQQFDNLDTFLLKEKKQLNFKPPITLAGDLMEAD